jgi:hypothetical protein
MFTRTVMSPKRIRGFRRSEQTAGNDEPSLAIMGCRVSIKRIDSDSLMPLSPVKNRQESVELIT